MSENELVSPGAELGFEEEYEAGEGVYIADGKIYSSVLGERVIEGRTIGVKAKKKLKNLSIGDVLYGQVGMVAEPVVALIEVLAPKKKDAYFPSNSDYCSLHASSLKRGFVRNIHDEIKIGDIVRAEVLEVKKTEVCLTTNKNNLGVVKAFCTKDRAVLEMKEGALICPLCGRNEIRKVSDDYGKAEV
ncbi:hypothetical protein AUJ17_00015 [Candidatus Micrarchaeota archaeon CG1_02_47_40]|nr:MAG: hypothetical protein AUJ17_00015 [Candidatus Micrarchaeota archaeon CG1_02_47_40]